MKFTREEILSLDPLLFSQEEKQQLIERFFPSHPLPEWKLKLRNDWDSTRRWSAYTGDGDFAPAGRPYSKSLAHLLANASLRKTWPRGNSVTAFCSWIYSLYLRSPLHSDLARGKAIERSVERSIASEIATIAPHGDWNLIYQDPLTTKPDPLVISALKIDGQPLWGAPDLVFQHKTSGAITIIERKASGRDIPSDGWPNLRAQLWAYAHADLWKNAPAINLVGEIWWADGTGVKLRQVLRWSFDDKNFRDENQELFDIYAHGSFVGNLADRLWNRPKASISGNSDVDKH